MYRFRFTALIYVFFLVLTSCTENFYQFSGYTWGTTYNIQYSGRSDLSDSVTVSMAAVDSSLSMFNPVSTVSKINSGRDMRADSLFADVFRLSQRVHHLSHGAFDPTVAPLVELWGFGTGGEHRLPDSADIVAALRHIGLEKCTLENGRVHMAADSMRLDFSAIAKGYGVDLVAATLARNGCSDYMVEIGGEINARGANRQGKPWRIQIDAPLTTADGSVSHDRLMVIELRDAAIATSGNYRNYRRMDNGQKVGHTISPLTGYPVQTATLSVSVIAPTCALADALATAAMAMPYPEARAMIDSLPEAEALFVLKSDQGMEVLATPGFPPAKQ